MLVKISEPSCAITVKIQLEKNIATKTEGCDSFRFDSETKECVCGMIGGNLPYFVFNTQNMTGTYWMYHDKCFMYTGTKCSQTILGLINTRICFITGDYLPHDVFFYVSTTSFNRNFTALIRNNNEPKMVAISPTTMEFSKPDPFDWSEASITPPYKQFFFPINSYTSIYNHIADGYTGYVEVGHKYSQIKIK